MSVRIRLARGGTKKRPVYRIVAISARSPRDGRFLETKRGARLLRDHDGGSNRTYRERRNRGAHVSSSE